MNKFFEKHDAMSIWAELNSEEYEQIHHKLLYKLTRSENHTKV